MFLGFLYLKGNVVDKALAEFNEDLRLNPHSHDAKTGLSSTFIRIHGTTGRECLLDGACIYFPPPWLTPYSLESHLSHEDYGR